MKKAAYISIINAIAIIAVVIGHLDVTGPNNDPNTPIANIIASFGDFQMPLFMCVSGFLFAMTSGYRKTYKELVKSKVRRLIVPFLFLSLFTFCFKLCLPASMLEHGVGLTPQYIFKIFFVPFRGPVPHLWFVVSLFTIFLLTPILKWTVKGKYRTIGAFAVLAAISITPPRTEILALDHTAIFTVWFYLGMVAELKGWFNKLDSWGVLAISTLLYAILIYVVNIPLAGGLLGIIMVFSLSHKLADYIPNLFGWWRNYTYQIYLLHMFPIMAFKYLYKRHIIANEDIWFTVIWICSLCLAILLPTIVAKIVERMPQKIRLLIGL